MTDKTEEKSTSKEATPAVSRERADAIESGRRKKLEEHTHRLKVFTIEADATGSEGAQSKKLENDDSTLELYLRDGKLIRRPFDFEFLSELGEYSAVLSECVQAMETNVDGFGHKIARIQENVPKNKEKEVAAEYASLSNFFRYAFLDGSFVDLRRRLRRDLEYTGNAYIEVIRHDVTGEINAFEHLPARDMWLGILSKQRIRIEQKRLALTPDGETYELQEQIVSKRFRPAFQSKDDGMSGVWFKEFGDPRVIDIESGDVVKGVEIETYPEEKRANEVIHLRLYCPRSAYGLPRYVSQLLTIFGERAAEEINYTTLKANNIPAFMLLVSNGMLTKGTIDRLSQFSNEQRAGKKDYSRFLVVEAESESADEGDTTNTKIEAKPLANLQKVDELFQNYSKNNERKVRQIWRLSSLFFGAGEQYNRATAHVSRKLAEEQVFGPERKEWDEFINRVFMPELGAVYHVFKSNTPNVTNDEDLIKVLQVAEKTGALTPRIARRIIEDIINEPLGSFLGDSADMADRPFTLTVAEEVKNRAAVSLPTQIAPEPVKTVKNSTGSPIVDELLRIRKQAEEAFGEQPASNVS